MSESRQHPKRSTKTQDFDASGYQLLGPTSGLRVLGRTGPALPSRQEVQAIRVKGFLLLLDSKEAGPVLPPPLLRRSALAGR